MILVKFELLFLIGLMGLFLLSGCSQPGSAVLVRNVVDVNGLLGDINWADQNISISSALNWTELNQVIPWSDDNLAGIAWGKVTGVPAFVKEVDANTWFVKQEDGNAWYVKQVDGNVWYYKVNADVNTTGTIKGVQVCIGNDCQTSWPTGGAGITQGQLDANVYRILGDQTPWTDANVDNGITLTNLTQITTRSYSDLQNLPTIPDTASIDANVYKILEAQTPWQDANLSTDFNATFVKQVDGNAWYMGTAVFNGAWPVQDANLSTDFNRVFVRQIDGNKWYVFATTFNSMFPIQDANLSTDFNATFVKQVDGNNWYMGTTVFNNSWPVQDANLSTDLNATFVKQVDGNVWYVMAGVFNSTFPIQDANLSTDLNRVFVRQSDGNTWFYKVNADVNTTGTIRGVQVCIGVDCQTAWPTGGITQTQIDANIYAILETQFPLPDANVDGATKWNALIATFNSAWPVVDGNLPHIPSDASIDANVYDILEVQTPWVDANVVDSLTVDWTGLQNYPAACGAGQYVSTIGDTLTCGTPSGSGITQAQLDANIYAILETQVPWQDSNLSTDFNATFVKQVDGNKWYVFASTFNSAFPIQDANLSTDLNKVFVRQSDGNNWYMGTTVFNSAWPVQDANLSTDFNHVFVRQSDGNTWYYKVNGDVNTTGTVKGVQVCIGSDCKAAWPASSGITQEQIDANIYAILEALLPLTDANINDVAWGKITGEPDIPTELTIDANIWDILEALLPLTDANINDVAWSKITGEPEIPTDATIDANIWAVLEALLPLTDANINDVDWSKITGEPSIPSEANIDANVWEILEALLPLTDVNINDVDWSKVTGAPTIPVLNIPWADSNISSSATWNAKLDWTALNSIIPWVDANINGISWSKITGAPTIPVLVTPWADANISSAGLWIKWASLPVPWADANVADDITLTNLTQITTRNYSDLSGLPHITTKANIDENIFARLQAQVPWPDANIASSGLWIKWANLPVPWVDANISSAVTWNAKPTGAVFNAAFPVADANLSAAMQGKPTGAVFTGAWPVADANLAVRYTTAAVFNGLLPVGGIVDANIANDITLQSTKDVNISSLVATTGKTGVSIEADANRICFPSDCSGMRMDWNGTALTIS